MRWKRTLQLNLVVWLAVALLTWMHQLLLSTSETLHLHALFIAFMFTFVSVFDALWRD